MPRRGDSLRKELCGWAFVSPWLLGWILLTAWPFAASLAWSFCEYDLISPPRSVGWENYSRLADEIASGVGFGQALRNTAYYSLVSVPLSILLGIGLAVLLTGPWPQRNSDPAWHPRSWRTLSWNFARNAYRTAFFLPAMIPTIAASIAWVWLLDPRAGIVSRVLAAAGFPSPGWFKGPGEALLPPGWFDFGSKDALALMAAWGAGNFMVIYIAALENIPRQVYEAAELDGAGPWTRFRSITLPLLTPVIFFNLVVGLIQSVQAFTQAYLVSEGSGEPAGSTLLVSLHLFLAAFADLEMGYASAISWVLLVVLASLTALVFRSARYWVFYQGGQGPGGGR